MQFNTVTDKTVSNNDKYTQECKDIYEDLRFAKITEIKLWSDILYWVCGFFTFVTIAIISAYTIPSFFREKRDTVIDIFSTFLIVLYICITVLSFTFCKKSYNKKRKEFYFIKTDDGEYEFDVVNIDGNLYIKYIADMRKRKGLSIEGKKCNIYSWSEKGSLAEDIGFYQYLVPPTRIFPRANWSSNNPHLYKKKKVVGNKTYYKFRSFGGVVGVRYARCIKLQDGVIKYISEQLTDGETVRGKRSYNLVYNSYKYTYDYVNDDSVKIYIPKYAIEYAKKNKFILPLQSQNLIAEK